MQPYSSRPALRSILGITTLALALGLSSRSALPRVEARTIQSPSAPLAAESLTAAEVELAVQTAAGAAAGEQFSVTVVDRAGRILAVWHRAGATDAEDERSLSLARTGAFFANNQAPLSSRTVRFLSGIRFPPGIRNQANAALYGIENTNRVAYNVDFLPGQEYPYPLNVEGTGPSLGITTGKADVEDSAPNAVNPAGFPLFKNGQVVGGVGVAGVGSASDHFLAAEFASFKATQISEAIRFPFSSRAVIFVEGISLPYVAGPVLAAVKAGRQVAGVAAGSFDPSPARYRVGPVAGGLAPEGYLVGPMAGSVLTQADVERLVEQSVRAADKTRALIRLPLGRRAKMVIGVGDLDGRILALYRMPDSTTFSLDVAVAKARNVVYFSGPTRTPAELPGLPIGTAVTNRTISFGAQPLFPPGISQTDPGPFFDLFVFDTANPGTQGAQAPNPYQNGIVFFPGSTPIYRNGDLIGGLGISGDGVEQDDFVAFLGSKGFRAPRNIQADRFKIRGVRMPYFKFPRNPTK